MVRRIGSLIRKDMAVGLRDNIMLYLLVTPLLMALVMRLFLPTVQAAKPTFAVDRQMETGTLEALHSYGRVELYDGYDAVRARVERLDDVIGIVPEGGTYKIIAEGNEAGELAAMTETVLARIVEAEPLAAFDRVNLARAGTNMRGITASLLLLSTVLLAGIFTGFAMIDERENKTVSALAVSPLRLSEFVAARVLLVLGFGLIIGILSSLTFIGRQADYAKLAVGILCSGGLGLIIGFVIGGLAQDQISGIAIVKVFMIFMTGIPIASLFVPAAYRLVFYPFPNYWSFLVFQNIFTGSQAVGFWTSCLYTAAVSAVFLVLLLPVLRRRWNLR